MFSISWFCDWFMPFLCDVVDAAPKFSFLWNRNPLNIGSTEKRA